MEDSGKSFMVLKNLSRETSATRSSIALKKCRLRLITTNTEKQEHGRHYFKENTAENNINMFKHVGGQASLSNVDNLFLGNRFLS